MRHSVLDLMDRGWEERRIRERSLDDVDALVLHRVLNIPPLWGFLAHSGSVRFFRTL